MRFLIVEIIACACIVAFVATFFGSAVIVPVISETEAAAGVSLVFGFAGIGLLALNRKLDRRLRLQRA